MDDDQCSLEGLTALVGLETLVLTDRLMRHTSLAPLGCLCALKELSLQLPRMATTSEDLEALSQLSVLQSLRLKGSLHRASGAKVTGVDFLSPRVHLRSLHMLWLYDLTSLAPLGCLSALTELRLHACGGALDDSLGQLTLLEVLRLYACPGALTSLVPLAQLPRLQELELTGCMGLTDVSPVLLQLTSLHVLRILHSERTHRASRLWMDRMVLAPHTALQNLELENVQVPSLGGPWWAHLTSLTNLALDSCTCEGGFDLAPLSYLACLSTLSLRYTSVADLAPLAPLQQLARLDVTGCERITTLLPLLELGGLRKLVAYGCRGLASGANVQLRAGLAARGRHVTLET